MFFFFNVGKSTSMYANRPRSCRGNDLDVCNRLVCETTGFHPGSACAVWVEANKTFTSPHSFNSHCWIKINISWDTSIELYQFSFIKTKDVQGRFWNVLLMSYIYILYMVKVAHRATECWCMVLIHFQTQKDCLTIKCSRRASLTGVSGLILHTEMLDGTLLYSFIVIGKKLFL